MWVRAASHATPPAELAQLLKHPDVTVGMRAAANPMTPPAALTAALTSTEEIAAAAAANPSTPASSLADTVSHATDRLLAGMANGPEASPDLLQAIAAVALKRLVERAGHPPSRDAYTPRDVLVAVALHPNTNAATLASLIGLTGPEVGPEVERAVAKHPNTESSLRRLLQSRTPSDAASSPSASPDELRMMVVDGRPDEATKRALVGNPNLPLDTASTLLQDSALHIVAHPEHASAEVLAMLATDGNSAHIRSEARLALLAKTDPAAIKAEHMSAYTSSTLMLRIARLDCPPATLAALAAVTNNPEVLIWLANNALTPLSVLEDLMAHPKQKVWTAAAAAQHSRLH